jgi:hypothetical protein
MIRLNLILPAILAFCLSFSTPILAEETAAAQPLLLKRHGMILLDYQTVPVPSNDPLDLLGFHYLEGFTDCLYLGIGGYTTLTQGQYGGFMAFDVTLHLQKKLIGNLFADAGVGIGGGGGGKSIIQSKQLSGSGGLLKGYAGLGYDWDFIALGAHYSRFAFSNSAIDHAQLDLFMQIPIAYLIGPYEYSGQTLSPAEQIRLGVSGLEGGENVLSFSLDNFVQLNPVGANRSTINLIDLQYSHFLTARTYAYFALGVGYHGLPLYNQVISGLGYRLRLFSKASLSGQVGIGSGGFAPQVIDTGPGLLVYPKLYAEIWLSPGLSASLSGGYLAAPLASSKNMTFGAALNYHLATDAGNAKAEGTQGDLSFHGFRMNVSYQHETQVKLLGKDHHDLAMAAVELDSDISDHFYVPIQASIANNDFKGYPGYGEMLLGLGLQSKHSAGDRFQPFAHMLLGANVLGMIAKMQLGLNYSLSANYALHAHAGRTSTIGIGSRYAFSANAFGLGLCYRFSIPSR